MRVGKTFTFLVVFVLFGIMPSWSQRKPIFSERISTAARVTYPSTIYVTANYVDGYVKILGNSKFIAPVGDNGRYRPFATAIDGVLGAYFYANPAFAISSNIKGGDYPPLPFGAPFSINSKDQNVGKISTKEYWDINGTLATRLTLTWNAESGIATLLDNGSLSKLFIVGWNGTKWIKIPSTIDVNALLGGQSNLTVGSITTNAALVPFTYNVYTFGSEASTTPTPTAKIQYTTDTTNFTSPSSRELTHKAEGPDQGNNNSNNDAIVFPNPAKDQLYVQTKDNRPVTKVAILDLSGKKLLQENMLGKSFVDITQLVPGIYFIHMVDEKGKTTTKKLIIVK